MIIEDEAKIPIQLLNKMRLEQVLPFVKRHEDQIQEFWGALTRLKKDYKLAVTKEELAARITDCKEEATSKVSYEMRA